MERRRKGLSYWTITLIQSVDPEDRLLWSARLFWFSVAAGVYCTFWLADTWYEQALMAISWGAVIITCIDIILTTDVRANETLEE